MRKNIKIKTDKLFTNLTEKIRENVKGLGQEWFSKHFF